MYCVGCGKEIKETWKNCPYCGEPAWADEGAETSGKVAPAAERSRAADRESREAARAEAARRSASAERNGSTRRSASGARTGDVRQSVSGERGRTVRGSRPTERADAERRGRFNENSRYTTPPQYTTQAPKIKPKKKFYKKWWFWLILVSLVAGIVVAILGYDGEGSKEEKESSGVGATWDTLADMYAKLGEDDTMPFSISPKARQFINDHEDLFPAASDVDEDTLPDLIDYEVEYKQISKNPDDFGNKLICLLDAYVMKIDEENVADEKKFTSIQICDDEDNIYFVFYDGALEDIYDEDSIRIIGLPLAMTNYDNVGGGSTHALVLAGSIVEKEMDTSANSNDTDSESENASANKATDFIGLTGSYSCGSDEDSGVINIWSLDDGSLWMEMGTWTEPDLLRGIEGEIIDYHTVRAEWGNATFYLQWSEEGIFIISREGSTDDNTMDIMTDGIKYWNDDYFNAS